ncbi:MAG: arginine repressor [Spirochaetales bacterium]|nr:arginine repressor [Spirochaetales bacterium]
MEDKKTRYRAIRRIISTHIIDSQDALLKHLEEEGFDITQATLSRDLRQLRVVKVSDRSGGYYYTFLETDTGKDTNNSLQQDFLRGFLSIAFSGNLALIKTLPGHAQSVAAAVDKFAIDEILGTLAGDDTVLLIPKDGIEREAMISALESKIPGLKEEQI